MNILSASPSTIALPTTIIWLAGYCTVEYPAPCPQIYIYKYEKHFQKMYRDVGMAMPKTTETRCRDGSVQGRHFIQRLHN